ncbi:oligosaccharide flippase family protein [Levilactobacillus brevis]|uniref:oligosaccharide flippase family protein n=1 Tax=Levilactobacillus brevis TaxID=1580 RepID=UPI0030D04259
MKLKISKSASNISLLYIMSISQVILPLVTLPYLARIFTVSNYGVISYVKSVMVYANLIMQFGFLLSGTREIVEAKGNIEKIGKIVGKITQAKLLLSVIAFIVLLIMIKTIPILNKHAIFTIIMFCPLFLDTFIYEYLFRGIEKMNIVTMRYLISKGIAVALTFAIIRNNGDLSKLPLLDVLGSLVAVFWVNFEIKRLKIKITFDSFNNVISALRESSIYFISDMSGTAFNALNTVCVGIFLSARDVAFWALIMQFIGAVQSLYYPIQDGIYPEMVKKRDLKLFRKIILFFSPLVLLGCLITFLGAPLILTIVGGEKYKAASFLMRLSVPLLFILFLTILHGWTLLGPIGKVKEVTFSTVMGSVCQVMGLVILVSCHLMTLFWIMVLRTLSQVVILLMYLGYFNKYKYLYNEKK